MALSMASGTLETARDCELWYYSHSLVDACGLAALHPIRQQLPTSIDSSWEVRRTKMSNPITAVGLFCRQVCSELKKVVAPTGRQLAAWAFACFVFVLLLMLLVTGLDDGLGWITLKIFGGGAA